VEAPKVRQVVSGWGDDEWSGILDRCPYLIAVLARAAHVSEEELEAKRPRALRALQVAARRRRASPRSLRRC